jgi:hypothetical protein
MKSLNQIENLLLQAWVIIKSYEKISKITGENFNIFNVLGLETREVRLHSSFLAELLNPYGSHERGNIFLKEFVESLKRKLLKEKIDIEIAFNCEEAKSSKSEHWLGYVTESEGGYIDILLTDNNHHHIIIENKIYAGDQRNQLIRYHSTYPEAPIVYLTLDQRGPSHTSTFNDKSVLSKLICISYKSDILPWLEFCKKNAVDHAVLRETITQYINLIKELTHQTMKNEEKMEIISSIIENKNHMEALCDLNENRIWDEIRMRILQKITASIFSDDFCKELGLRIKHPVESFEKSDVFDFWYYEDSWIFCIYFYFENIENVFYGIDVLDEKTERKESDRLKFNERLASFGKPLNFNNWIWVANFQEYSDISWYDLNISGRELFKQKIEDILLKVRDLMKS